MPAYLRKNAQCYANHFDILCNKCCLYCSYAPGSLYLAYSLAQGSFAKTGSEVGRTPISSCLEVDENPDGLSGSKRPVGFCKRNAALRICVSELFTASRVQAEEIRRSFDNSPEKRLLVI